MSESTFRAVVAGVLLGALALAVAIVIVLLPQPAEPAPTAASLGPTTTSLPSPTPTRSAGPAFVTPDAVSVGLIPRGSSSDTTLVLRFLEPTANAIPNASGSLRVRLADHAGNGSTVSFAGEPTVVAPGSLGAAVVLVMPNVLMLSIEGSDVLNVELITIRGLGIRASSAAALGGLALQVGEFTGSLAGGITNPEVPSPGTVVAPSPSPGG